MDVNELNGYIQIAEVLITLGVSTAEKIRDFFASKGIDDDAQLAAIMAEVDRRLARRS